MHAHFIYSHYRDEEFPNFESYPHAFIVTKVEPDLFQSFNPKPFARTLSYRDFITSLSFALLFLAWHRILHYYSSENWMQSNEYFLRVGGLALLIPANHVLYRLEHRRSNNFIGRNFHDYIFLMLTAVVFKLHAYLFGLVWSLQANTVSAIVSLNLAIFLILIFEAFLSLLKRLLNKVKWHVI
jgi:hypothetical protein